MLDGIVTVLVVVGIFTVVAVPLALYAYLCDPHHFGVWASEWRMRRQRTNASPPTDPARRRRETLRTGFSFLHAIGSDPAEPDTTATPVVTSRPSPPARLEYWMEGAPDRRAPVAKRPRSARR